MRITFLTPFNKKAGDQSAHIRINDIIDILSPIADLKIIKINAAAAGDNIIKLVFIEAMAWIQAIAGMVKYKRHTDYLFMRGRLTTLVMPLFAARLLKIKAIPILEAFGYNLVDKAYIGLIGRILRPLYKILEYICFASAYRLAAINGEVVMYMPERYKQKTIPVLVSMRYISDKFKVNKDYNERKNNIAYIGRFSKEKGIYRLANIIKTICYKYEEVKFILAGNGELLQYIKDDLLMLAHYQRVLFHNWVEHEDIPKILNLTKITVIPSNYEGVSTTAIEAMACGNIVIQSDDELFILRQIEDIIRDKSVGEVSKTNTIKAGYYRIENVRQRWTELIKCLD